MKLEYSDIILAPCITEKSTDLKDEKRVLCFKVHKSANKISIKLAVEKLFDTKVDTVRVANFFGKKKKQGKFIGKTASWKKAYITLDKDAKMIEYVEVV